MQHAVTPRSTLLDCVNSPITKSEKFFGATVIFDFFNTNTMKNILTLFILAALAFTAKSQSLNNSLVVTEKPPLHGKHWMAITGKPLAATAGAMIFSKGGNAVDAACAMLAATCTMWDVLSWGGETQALIYNPKTGKVIGIDALGVAPTGATAELFKQKGMKYPPELGPLAAVTPGTRRSHGRFGATHSPSPCSGDFQIVGIRAGGQCASSTDSSDVSSVGGGGAAEATTSVAPPD